jgi:hypothetical protein
LEQALRGSSCASLRCKEEFLVMRHALCIAFFFMLLGCGQALAGVGSEAGGSSVPPSFSCLNAETPHDESSAASKSEEASSINQELKPAAPHIPEPMVFDLVRSLGARRGELEINSLVFPGRRSVKFAPEIEYEFADGYSVELELPFENQTLKTYKAALQGTFNVFHGGSSVQGWQIIGERARFSRERKLDALHLFGHRFNERLSMLTMEGVRRRRDEADQVNHQLLLNPTIFCDVTKRSVVGVETNLEIGARERRALVIPQVQLAVGKNYGVQFGVGMEKESFRAAKPTVAFRLIRNFEFGRSHGGVR